MSDSGDSQDVSRWLPPVPEGSDPPAGSQGAAPQSGAPGSGATAWPPQPPAPPPRAPASGQPQSQPAGPPHQGAPAQQWQPPHAPPPNAPPGWHVPTAPAWGQPIEPENKPANVGFALAITGAGILLFSVGFLSIVSLPLGIAGWVWGRQGVRKVATGETRKNETLARSAVIVGIITTVLSALALIALIVLFAVVDDFGDTSDDGSSPDGERTTVSARIARS